MAKTCQYLLSKRFGINRTLLTLSRTFSSHTIDPDYKTSVNIMNKDSDDTLMINSFSPNGFRLNNGMFVFGPIAVFPKSVLAWNVEDHTSINEDSLTLFWMLEPKLDILIIGNGKRGNLINPNVIRFLRSKRIGVEVLPTEDACATFNFLNAEKRCVAGALLPPESFKHNASETIAMVKREMELKETENWLSHIDKTDERITSIGKEVNKLKQIDEEITKKGTDSKDND